jgi:hypothetical protein
VLITDIEHIQNRGYYFKIIDADNKQTLVANIYALVGYNIEKKEFFNNIMDAISVRRLSAG